MIDTRKIMEETVQQKCGRQFSGSHAILEFQAMQMSAS